MTTTVPKKLRYPSTPVCLIDVDRFCSTHHGRHSRFSRSQYDAMAFHLSYFSTVFCLGMVVGLVWR